MDPPNTNLPVFMTSINAQKTKYRNQSFISTLRTIIVVTIVCGIWWWCVHTIFGSSSQIISRRQWMTKVPSYKPPDFNSPIYSVIISTTDDYDCTTESECLKYMYVLEVNGLYMTETFNFYLCGDGSIYEFSGWNNVALHTPGYNDNSIGIGFIGKFNEKAPNQKQFDALKTLLEEGVRREKLAYNYVMYPSDWFNIGSNSPGDHIVNVIEKWPHYAKTAEYERRHADFI